MAGQVYLSYGRGDRAYVDRLATHLRAAGLPVWYDYELHTDERYSAVIQRQIEACAVFVVVLTPAAAGSKWVNREISYADHVGKPILPLLLERCPPPILVKDLETEDVTGGRMPAPGFVVDLHQLVRPPPRDSPPLSFSRPPPRLGFAGRLVDTLTAPEPAAVTSVAWSPDGRFLASGGGDNAARIWDAADGTHLSTLTGHHDWVRCVAWSPDSRRLATGSDDRTVRVWDVIAGAELAVLGGYAGGVHSVAWAPDGSAVAAGGLDGLVSVRDPGGATRLGFTLAKDVNAVAWSANGQYLAAGGDDHTARVWAVASGEQVRALDHGSLVMAIAWSPAGQLLVTGCWNGTVRGWADESVQLEYAGHTGPVLAIAWSPDGSLLATGSRDQTVRVWAAATGTPIGILSGHQDAVRGVSWAPDGRRLATASWDQTIRIWDALSPQ